MYGVIRTAENQRGGTPLEGWRVAVDRVGSRGSTAQQPRPYPVPMRSAGTSARSLISILASIRIPSDSPMAPDRLPRTPAFPKIKKGRGPIQVEEANGTTAKVMSVSALHLWHPDRFPAELARARCCVRIRSVERLLRAIGFQGITCGGGNTENGRHSASLKYWVNVGYFRAALWQFGGYAQNNASTGAYQFPGPRRTWDKGVLSIDAIYSYCQRFGVAHACARKQ
jgi:hypothetical protein